MQKLESGVVSVRNWVSTLLQFLFIAGVAVAIYRLFPRIAQWVMRRFERGDDERGTPKHRHHDHEG